MSACSVRYLTGERVTESCTHNRKTLHSWWDYGHYHAVGLSNIQERDYTTKKVVPTY